VKVVFAPDYNHALRSPRAERRGVAEGKTSPRSIDTTPSRILSAMTGGRGNASTNPAEFAAPDGLIGIRTGPESVMATIVTVGENGRLRSNCSALAQALELLRAAAATDRSAGRKTGNDR
jgi:hypothetical protein